MKAHGEPIRDIQHTYIPLATFEDDSDALPATVNDVTRFDHGLTAAGRKASGLPYVQESLRFARRGVELFNNNTGLLLIALSQGFASLMGVCVKKLREVDASVHPLELIFVRMVMTWVVCVGYMSFMKVPDPVFGPKAVRLLLGVRGISGFFGLFGTYYALQYLSLSDATVLSFLSPMTTAITGAVLLKEDLTIRQLLASVFSFAGVILIARPEFMFGKHIADTEGTEMGVTSSERLGAVGVALVGVLGITGAYTSVRAIGKRAHPMHSMVAFSLVCILTCPIGMIITHTPVVIPDNWPTLSMILAVTLCGFGAQMTLTTGLQRETAGRGSTAMYIQIIFALIFQRVFFHTSPPPLSIVGTVIILSSAIYVAVRLRLALHVVAADFNPNATAQQAVVVETLKYTRRVFSRRRSPRQCLRRRRCGAPD
ncbi:EamA-like transporter family-domain-containing protein [Daedaleopsis nitida]|nr:EamA-like transporter family-domain-containing protein [Daedaleopsis nitida]